MTVEDYKESPATRAALRRLLMTALIAEAPLFVAAVVAYLLTSDLRLVIGLVLVGAAVGAFACIRYILDVRAAVTGPAAPDAPPSGPSIVD